MGFKRNLTPCYYWRTFADQSCCWIFLMLLCRSPLSPCLWKRWVPEKISAPTFIFHVRDGEIHANAIVLQTIFISPLLPIVFFSLLTPLFFSTTSWFPPILTFSFFLPPAISFFFLLLVEFFLVPISFLLLVPVLFFLVPADFFLPAFFFLLLSLDIQS